ncbi:putative COPII coat assembly protein SEC16 [Phytophthora cinnamomi]|uniref:putative COPII coat assembly protein SEC16 n=1 Tax=Phytophthora cinnamomi TaxID=4785 RepID=UPI00355A0C58|nr:putative COPII coat assembly protein SEC16 [Phytophthora cinnamomi]
MDAARGGGFFSAPGAGGATRARPVSAGTRVRPKPSAAASQDFFASLGIDATSRGRTGSSASSSSSRSYSSMSTSVRPASASGASLSAGWRPPPIGGLGGPRAPPPAPSAGALRVAGVQRAAPTTTASTTTVTTTATTTAATTAATTTAATTTAATSAAAAAATAAAAAASSAGNKPAQLFSMEDAEDLYSEDGWGCDSPSAVLSNPERDDTAAGASSAAAAAAAPALAAAAAAAAEAPEDEFAWGDDDDAFASPVAKAAAPSTMPPPVQLETSAASAFETKTELTEPTPPQAAGYSAAESSSSAFEATSFIMTQPPPQETKAVFGHAQGEAAMPPPPAAVAAPATSFPVEAGHSSFQTASFAAAQVPPPAASAVAAEVQQEEQWDEDWDQHQGTGGTAAESETTIESTITSMASVTTTTTTTTMIQTETATAPVELSSPGAAAGEFWGDGDEDELFDHDDHADEEWDESIKVAAPVVKTSNKYKDPCVAPPSCLVSFGFGGNVVTMFPKRKLRLNIAGSGYRNSPRGLQAPSEFDNGGNCELRKGPHPDLALKRSNELRELLLVGDRKGAVSSAMSAQMWPEAMLIASFTDKEEYRRVLRTYLDETYATGDPCRALFMSFADQQEKSVQEPKRLLQTNAQQPAESLILSGWVSHAQVLLANRTADTNKILTELGDRLWNEAGAVAAAHVCYLLAGIQVEAPMPSSKMALLGGDHRTPKEARFYVSPGAVQRTEIYEWAQKHSKGASANLMIPFQGYKLIYAMLLADHGKLEAAFKYVSSMLAVIKAVTATMKPGTSMYLEGMKNQLTVLDDRLRQHLGQDRVASVAASASRGGGRKQGGKWGLGSALSIMGKIVNRVVEGNESATAAPAGPSATTPGGLYANEATPPAASYPSTPSVTAPTPSPAPSYPQQHVQQTPPTSSHGPSPVPANLYGHATPPVSQGSAPGSSNGYNRAPAATPAGPYSRPGANAIPSSGPFSGNGRLGPQQHQQQASGPFSGNGKPAPSGPFSNSGPPSRGHGTVPLMRSQHSMEPPGSNHSTHSNSSFKGMQPAPVNNVPHHPLQPPQQQQQQQQPPLSQSSQHSQDTPTARPAFQKPAPIDVSHDDNMSQPKALAAGLAAEVAASLPPTDAAALSGPSSDKGKASPKFKSVKKPARSKTPPPSGSSKGSGWLSGISSFIATKMNPEAKVAKLGEQMEAYYDEKTKRWVFPGETASEEPTMPSAPPTGPLPGSAPASSATGAPPPGANSAPGSMSSGPAPSDDPLAALMAPPPSHMLMKKDPLAAMMAPPARGGVYGARRGGSTAQRKPPRPQFAVFKPTAASAAAPDEPSE